MSTMTIKEICSFLEYLAPLDFQEDYDNAGLLTGDPGREARNPLLCLDITPTVMEEAILKKSNLIIAHHPFLFRGMKKFIPGQPETEILKKAFIHDIAVYAIHTNLDNAMEGLNAFLLQKLGINGYSVLAPKANLLKKLITFCPAEHAEKVRQAIFDAGAGKIGHYDCCSFNLTGEGPFRASEKANPFVGKKNSVHNEKEVRIEVIFPAYLESQLLKSLLSSHPYEEVAYDIYPLNNNNNSVGAGLVGDLAKEVPVVDFLQMVKKKLDVERIRHTQFKKSKIRRVAICSGSGAFLIPEARRSAADIFLTADLKYHDFFLADDNLVLADIGHYESEHWVKEWLYAALIEKFPNFAFLISEINTNPVIYY